MREDGTDGELFVDDTVLCDENLDAFIIRAAHGHLSRRSCIVACCPTTFSKPRPAPRLTTSRWQRVVATVEDEGSRSVGCLVVHRRRVEVRRMRLVDDYLLEQLRRRRMRRVLEAGEVVDVVAKALGAHQ